MCRVSEVGSVWVGRKSWCWRLLGCLVDVFWLAARVRAAQCLAAGSWLASIWRWRKACTYNLVCERGGARAAGVLAYAYRGSHDALAALWPVRVLV